MDLSPRTQLPSALILSLGGTIAMAAQGAGNGGVAPRLTAEDLVTAVPELVEEVELELRDFRKIPGAWLEFDDIAAVAELLNKQATAGTTGFVITQGADTLEETAYLPDLLYKGAAPVIVTGAMRNAQMAGADGPANLLADVRTAVSPQARDTGVLEAFTDELHAACHLQKVHSTNHDSAGLKADSADGRTSHLQGGTVQVLAEVVIEEWIAPEMTRPRDPGMYDVPLLTFGPAD